MAAALPSVFPPNSVALPALQSLGIQTFIDPNYDKFQAFCKALKIFQKSFSHYRAINSLPFDQMWDIYRTQMAELYDLTNDSRLTNFDMSTIDGEVATEQIEMLVGIYQMQQKEKKTIEAQVRIVFNHVAGVTRSVTFNLDCTKLKQVGQYENLVLSHAQFFRAVEEDKVLVLNYREKDPNQQAWRTFNGYQLPYRQIHAEGFHQWLMFGVTRILFHIEYETILPQFVTPLYHMEIMSFQLHTIWYMMQKRLTHFQSIPNNQTHLHREGKKRKMTYVLDKIDPNTIQAYWGEIPDMAQNENIECEVKYMDMQIGFEFGEELVSVTCCTCNELCNLNAFFHYNPIYRFLLVQHNRHYIKNRTTVANVYQLILANCLVVAISQALPVPIFDLLNSSTKMLFENYEMYYKKRALKTKWIQSWPSGVSMEAMAYKCLRQVNLSQIMFNTFRRTPFHEKSFVNIEKCMQIMYSLHRRIGTFPQYIPQNSADRKKWSGEYEQQSHNHYFKYMEESLNMALNNTTIQINERLFTKDYEQTKVAINSAQLAQITKWQHLQSSKNEMNLVFLTKSFIFSINQIRIALSKFEPMSRLYIAEALNVQYRGCVNIHRKIGLKLRNNFQDLQDLHKVNLRADTVPQIFNNQLANCRISFHQFFKLKVYSEMHSIECKFLESLFRATKSDPSIKDQAFESFGYIWQSNWIEDLYTNIQVPELFAGNYSYIGMIREFYTVFYGPPQHYAAVIGAQQPIAITVVIDSLFEAYAKRRFWERGNGDRRQLFQNIIQRLDTTLNEFINSCHTIYSTYIIPTVFKIRTHYTVGDANKPETEKMYCIVLDEVIYWLIRATLFNLTGALSLFFATFQRLTHPVLRQNEVLYTLSKPGLVSLLRTKLIVFQKLDELQNRFIAFSNPFDNISDVFRQTKYNVKNIYKEFFRITTSQWKHETLNLRRARTPPNVPAVKDVLDSVLKLHLVSGASFLVSFINESRSQVQYIRKLFTQYTRRPTQGYTSTEMVFNQFWNLCLVWFRNVTPHQLIHPFIQPYWDHYLAREFAVTGVYVQNFIALPYSAGQVVQNPLVVLTVP